MTSSKPRTQETYLQFLLYLDETGLDEELRAICKGHHVTPRDVYLDARGPTVHAARLECWWWLVMHTRKSPGEVAKLFDRDPGSIRYGMLRLGEQALILGRELNAESVRAVAEGVADSAAEKQAQAGERVAATGLGVRARATRKT